MKRLIAAFALLVAGAAEAQVPPTPDHLTPVDNVYTAPWIYDFEAYDADVVNVLSDMYDRDVFARMIAISADRNERATAISIDGDDVFSVIGLQPSHHIWLFTILADLENGRLASYDENDEIETTDAEIAEFKALLPETIDDVSVEKCSLNMAEEAGKVLYSLWGEMLFRTRYEDKRPVSIGGETPPRPFVDGVGYVFGFEYGETLTGQTHSPDETAMPGRFVAVAETLNRACWAQDESLIEEAVAGAEAMLSALEGSRY